MFSVDFGRSRNLLNCRLPKFLSLLHSQHERQPISEATFSPQPGTFECEDLTTHSKSELVERSTTISLSSLLRDTPRSSDELQFSCLFRVSLGLIPIEGAPSGGASREEIVNYGKKSTAGDSTEEDSSS